MNAALSSNVNSMRTARVHHYHMKSSIRSVDSPLQSFAKQRIMVNVRNLILVVMEIIVGGIACEQSERFTHVAALCACIFLLSDNKGEDHVIMEKIFQRAKPQHQTPGTEPAVLVSIVPAV